jgi:hypothetical protein
MPAISLGAPVPSLGMQGTNLEGPRITVKKSGKNDIFGNIAGVPGNHGYFSLFNDF